MALAEIFYSAVSDALNLTPVAPKKSANHLNIAFHPTVQLVTEGLFKSGYYRHAILEACLQLNTTMQQQTGRPDLDGVKLMQALSKDPPLLRLSNNADEQLGFMWLFSGVMMALRNPNAHRISQHPSREETIEWLVCISALFRVLDKAQPLSTP